MYQALTASLKIVLKMSCKSSRKMYLVLSGKLIHNEIENVCLYCNRQYNCTGPLFEILINSRKLELKNKLLKQIVPHS